MVATVAPETPPDLLADVRRAISLQRWSIIGVLLLNLLLVGAAVAVVVYSGQKSMAAFEVLPRYQVNVLRQDFETEVAAFEASMANTKSTLASEKVIASLQRARQLPSQILMGEEDFIAAQVLFGQMMALSAEKIGGTLEWNRHLQDQLKTLQSRAKARQSEVKSLLERYPSVPAAAPDLTPSPAEPAPVADQPQTAAA